MLRKQINICTLFWESQLAFLEYKHGDKLLEFKRLWSSRYTEILSRLTEGMEGVDVTSLLNTLWELCVLTMVDGPVSVLQALLEKKYLRIDYQFDNDPGLLHLACVLRNMEAVQLLTKLGVSSEIKDKSGKTADEVCFCEIIGKHLPLKLQKKYKENRKKGQSAIGASLQDKEAIFQLAANPKNLYELQKKLQMFDFQVNWEKKEGDYLVHIAAKAGMCQLPLLMSLVRIQKADINLCNADGMTPLMIFAQDGDCNMCDTLLCILGANPDKQNTVDGKTALHYAVMQRHYQIVIRLLQRGADVNVEDNNKGRPDDVMLPDKSLEDCRLPIQKQREKRFKELSDRIKDDVLDPVELRSTDLSVVDTEYDTLIMIAAQNDRFNNLEVLLDVVGDSVAPINVPNNKTGLTALAMAAKAGHDYCCEQLLRKGADPSIRDMNGYLPLHHAVINNHENVVSVFKKCFPLAYVGISKAMKYSKSSPIYVKLKEMYEKRQSEIVQPQLRISAVSGNADELFSLLEEGDDVNSKSDNTQQAPLFLAIENRHLDVLRLLVEKGLDLKTRDVITGNTVLHIVSQTGDVETAKYLMKLCYIKKESIEKLDVNAFNNDMKTPLQVAAEKGDINMIYHLMEYGATPAVLNSQGILFTTSEFKEATALINDYRNKHTQDVIKLVSSKSKNSVLMLKKIWVPRFDHNLRDKNGDTALMVACRYGLKEMVSFLLLDAVYKDQITDDEGEDIGVLRKPQMDAGLKKDLTKSQEKVGELDLPAGATYSTVLYSRKSPNPENQCLERVINFTVVDRPKGLSIYHDGCVSHVCAVDQFGNTPLHCTINGGDFVEIAMMLIETDSVVINMKNYAGLAPVYLACEKGRKKTLEKLLTVNNLDLSGSPPEELTKNKTIIKMIQKARLEQSVRTNASIPENSNISALTESLPADTAGTKSDVSLMTDALPTDTRNDIDDDDIDFDLIENIYTAMKIEHRYNMPRNDGKR